MQTNILSQYELLRSGHQNRSGFGVSDQQDDRGAGFGTPRARARRKGDRSPSELAGDLGEFLPGR